MQLITQLRPEEQSLQLLHAGEAGPAILTAVMKIIN